MQGNGAILQPTGTSGTISLYVGGKFKYPGSNPTVGTSSAKIKQATIVGRLSQEQLRGDVQLLGELPRLRQHLLLDAGGHPEAARSTRTGTRTRGRARCTRCNDDPTNAANVSTYPSGYTATQFKNAVFDSDTTRNTSLGTVDLLRSATSTAASTTPTAR